MQHMYRYTQVLAHDSSFSQEQMRDIKDQLYSVKSTLAKMESFTSGLFLEDHAWFWKYEAFTQMLNNGWLNWETKVKIPRGNIQKSDITAAERVETWSL